MEKYLTALWIYLGVVNIVLFILMGVDKVKAIKGSRRIPEATLFLLAIIGGGLGGMVKIEQLTQKLNEFISAFNSHTHEIPTGVVAVAGSATAQSNPAPVMVPAITSQHPSVAVSDYEDEKVKH